ncbi:protein of unknown function [Candidatus Nitrosocaldus cavascurensis]|uniref:Uncharacterized protein n=1 Tax=Candidatus Nitrosocaldus cavascurensis TaxID=2058097 RepID=A0A2K5APT5_9ARCH|nr:protein of unknown function [Candidatus Nitrosocaldus cavascurensis]
MDRASGSTNDLQDRELVPAMARGFKSHPRRLLIELLYYT